MKSRSSLQLAVAVMAVVASAQAYAGGYIVVNSGATIDKAPQVGAYDDGIVQLYGPRQDYVGLVTADHVIRLYVNNPGIPVDPTKLDQYAVLYHNHDVSLIDPEAQYLNRRPGHLDENHSLVRVQRAYNALHALPGRVITRHSAELQRTDSPKTYQPRMIILRPDYLETRPQTPPQDQSIPTVPRPAGATKTGQMVLAD